jgi:tetratricopeptide (TPR) repeat protein
MTAPHVPIDRHFTSWLFRAYLDLGPVQPRSPHHLSGLDFGIRALIEDRPYPRIQSALNPSFRAALLAQTRMYDHDVTRPAELPVALRTERWQKLCELCAGFADLTPTVKVRLAWLLGKMCFQSYVLELVPEAVERTIAQSPEQASLAYIRAYARYRINLDDRNAPYSLAEFERIALAAPPGIARIDAHYQMVVQNVKHTNDLGTVVAWHERQRVAIESSRAELDDFTYPLVMSRYHRVGGFIPQMRREIEGTVYEMDLAEKFAMELPRRTDVERTAADEMLYPVLESRTKEAIWIGDHELALDRARRTVDLSPNDARAWLHLGQVLVDREDVEGALAAYRRAARLSPPGREIASFMVGQCYEAIDDLESACDAYLAALDADPLGIAAAERLHEVATQLDNSHLVAWTSLRLAELRALKEQVAAPRPEPYKHLPPPETAANP